MNILNEIDSTLHYENIEKAWKKHKFSFIFAIIAIFAAVISYNMYYAQKNEKYGNDLDILYKLVLETQTKDNAEMLNAAIAGVKSDEVTEMLLLQKAKLSFFNKDYDQYVKLLEKLNTAKATHIKSLSIFMLAEYKLNTSATDAIKYISANKDETSFTYPMMQDLLALAYIKEGKKDLAEEIYVELSQMPNLPESFKKRALNRLSNLAE